MSTSKSLASAVGLHASASPDHQFRQPLHDLVSGGGEMDERIRAFDWSKTSIGAPETWSASLRMMVPFLLANRFPLLLWWGPEYISIYNDAYRPVLGAKHPWGLGRPLSECWSEIWDVLKPLVDTPFKGGPATWNEDIELEINRHGFLEETHFTVAYSPVPDESVASGIGGVLATVHEITDKIVGERRAVALRDLGARATVAKSAQEACAIAAETLARHSKDIPFVLLYLLDTDGKRAVLAGAAGVEAGADISPSTIDLTEPQETAWPLAQALRSETMLMAERLNERFAVVPCGPWSDPPHTAAIVPIPSNKAHEPAGVMVTGISSRLKFDDFYRDFLGLVKTQIATAIANARSYEEERRRAEALAEIDRTKTAFFSNVSHEFRTPLTLMLGPLEEALAGDGLPPEERERLDVAHRNSLRLLKLVNSLLDFSRIEAGRAQAVYEPVDLSALTADLASNFRSACESAGLSLVIDCPDLPEPVYVDREMWEKVVLNLLSNAFKFTFDGQISVRMRAANGMAEFSVRDTGVGVPESELPRLFERFHRIANQRSRTHEGSGIGLALVQELVKLHGGTIGAESDVGQGTCFTIGIPFGTEHLPPEHIEADRRLASTSVRAEAYVEEALRWRPAAPEDAGQVPVPAAGHSEMPIVREDVRILLADDNADMRAYVSRLLGPLYVLYTAPDGQTALDAIRVRRPDLVLADVMMPGLDGFGLLRAIRGDPALRDLPVIMLSARAGEESRIEGLDAGADDYLTKPFSARELLARVEVHLKLKRLREQSQQALRASAAELADEVSALTSLREASGRLWRAGSLCDGLDEMLAASIELLGADMGNIQIMDETDRMLVIATQRGFDPDFLDFFREVSPEDESACGRALRTGDRIVIEDVQIDAAYAPLRTVARAAGYRAVQHTPLIGLDGGPLGMISTYWSSAHHPTERALSRLDLYARLAIDFIERFKIEDALRRSEQELADFFDNASIGLHWVGPDGIILRANQAELDMLGCRSEEYVGRNIAEFHDDPAVIEDILSRLKRGEKLSECPARLRCKDGSLRDVVINSSAFFENERFIHTRCFTHDVTERKRAEQHMQLLTRELEHRVKNILATAIALARLTKADTIKDFTQTLIGRLQALASAQSLLASSRWHGASLQGLIEEELAAFAHVVDQVTTSGPALELAPDAAPLVAMILHELTTNAAKYGALSRPTGRITVEWDVDREHLNLRWREMGGPAVERPMKMGFGSHLIESTLPSLNGEIHYDWNAEGLACTVRIPVDRLR